MAEAPHFPAGAQGQGNDPGPAAPHNVHGHVAPNALAPIVIPPAANAPPPVVAIIKGPDLTPLTSTIKPLDPRFGSE
jgi:hypothetical protein